MASIITPNGQVVFHTLKQLLIATPIRLLSDQAIVASTVASVATSRLGPVEISRAAVKESLAELEDAGVLVRIPNGRWGAYYCIGLSKPEAERQVQLLKMRPSMRRLKAA
jgi:predicted transcriptional regulator of viral defense system